MDADQKYVYDPETCSFQQVETTWKDWLAYAGQIAGLAVILAGLLVWGLDQQWIASPNEQTLKVEKEALERQLDQVNGRMTVLSSRLDSLAERDRTLYRRLFQMEPISDDVRQVGVGGSDPYQQFDEMGADTEALLKRTAQKLDKLERQVSLLFLQDEDLAAGDYVLVQLGQAVAKVSAEDAEASWALLDEILAAQDGNGGV